jgi:hypothetical protein
MHLKTTMKSGEFPNRVCTVITQTKACKTLPPPPSHPTKPTHLIWSMQLFFILCIEHMVLSAKFTHSKSTLQLCDSYLDQACYILLKCFYIKLYISILCQEYKLHFWLVKAILEMGFTPPPPLPHKNFQYFAKEYKLHFWLVKAILEMGFTPPLPHKNFQLKTYCSSKTVTNLHFAPQGFGFSQLLYSTFFKKFQQ